MGTSHNRRTLKIKEESKTMLSIILWSLFIIFWLFVAVMRFIAYITRNEPGAVYNRKHLKGLARL